MKRLALILLLVSSYQAVRAENVETMTNEQVSKAWQQNNPGAQAPELVEGEDGSTKVKWTGSVTPEIYTNSVTTANGATNTPLKDGTFHKNVVKTDIRKRSQTGAEDFFQIGLTESDDKAVLRAKPTQVNNLLLGHIEEKYSVLAGDIVPGFSSLSSSLGTRGFMGQRSFSGDASATAFIGTVSESWEALTGQVTRNQFLRDTYGLKVEKSLNPEIKIFGTGQSGRDRKGTLTNSTISSLALASRLSSATAGLQYTKDQTQLTGEIASSTSRTSTMSERSGNGYLFDGHWANETLGFHGGYHSIDADFATLSSMAMPGVTESYGGGDWITAPWLSLGFDLRKTENHTIASSKPVSTTDSTTLRASSNFSSTDWGVSAQNTASRTDVTNGNDSRVDQTQAMLSYTTEKWRGGLGYAVGEVRNSNEPTSNSDTQNLQGNIGYSMNSRNGDPNLPTVWNFDTMLSVTLQDQKFTAGGKSKNKNYNLTFTGQRAEWGQVNLILSTGSISQPTAGASDLRTDGVQLDLSHDFKNNSTLRVYIRNTQRNINDPLLESTEQVTGAQYNYNF